MNRKSNEPIKSFRELINFLTQYVEKCNRDKNYKVGIHVENLDELDSISYILQFKCNPKGYPCSITKYNGTIVAKFINGSTIRVFKPSWADYNAYRYNALAMSSYLSEGAKFNLGETHMAFYKHHRFDRECEATRNYLPDEDYFVIEFDIPEIR